VKDGGESCDGELLFRHDVLLDAIVVHPAVILIQPQARLVTDN
jgi:hypothetical protein